MSKNYGLSLVLTRFEHVKKKMKGKDGELVECLVIPIEKNHFVKGKVDEKGNFAVYANTSIHVRDENDEHGRIGFQKQKFPKKFADMSDAEKEIENALPFLGDLIEFKSSQNDSSGAAADGVQEEDDDLPF